MGRNSAPRSPCEPVRVWDPIRVPCAPGKHLPGMEIKEEMLMKKRFVALLLCLIMVVGLIPAAMAGGTAAGFQCLPRHRPLRQCIDDQV